ncbi:MAG TPA: DUF1501 domain-containing protein [Ilumatobacteraceae bacterium]|nr:DUF1501 domain-containing protein [Ilumatobacteraceae bacterium]
MTVLDRDIDTAPALAMLTSRDDDPFSLSRRRFLQLVGLGVGAGLTGGSLLEALGGRDSWAAPPVGPNDGILLIVGMYGGNDGFNTVVPFNDSSYYAQHGSLAIPGAQTLQLNDRIGLNSRLTTLKRFWDTGQLAIVEGVGYPTADLSHFNSMAIWMSGIRSGVPSSGWIGRWLDGHLPGGPDLYTAASIGSGVPLHMLGQSRRATAVPPGRPGFGGGTSGDDLRMYDAVRSVAAPAGRGPWHDALSGAFRDQVDVAARLTPILPSAPADGLVGRLDVAARLINADLGFRVLEAGWGDFDSHANQPTMHASRMTELNNAIEQFFLTLDPRWATRVTVMTFSEFGRTSFKNDGNGTDHGTANCAFVLGANVKGGTYGQHPNLAGLSRWQRVGHTVDFRSYYTSVMDGWLGGGASTVLGGTYENLGLFSLPPGQGSATTPISGGGGGGSMLPGYFVPLSPARVADTRDGAGGVPVRRLGASERLAVTIAGRGGVPPTGAIAVVANVTAVDVTEPTFLTVCPGGAARPETSNLNPMPGRATPNLVVMGIGADGTIDVHNSVGETNCIVDVFGYFDANGGDRLNPLEPSRLLDTRSGVGAPSGAVGRQQRVDLQVTGRGGVPGDATAVVLNVTVDQPTSNGFLSIGPAGEAIPGTSNLNFVAGLTVPNLVVCKVGDGGMVSFSAECDSLHLIADVFGYFAGDTDGSKVRTVRPHRLLDTRNGTGAPQLLVGPANPVTLQVTGLGVVPSSATAVVLNVTATQVTTTSFVTVWPTGTAMPDTSNLNMVAGGTVANLVITKLGPGGTVDLANAFGEAHLIADVTGYFED